MRISAAAGRLHVHIHSWRHGVFLASTTLLLFFSFRRFFFALEHIAEHREG
jgi:hypothetical protein